MRESPAASQFAEHVIAVLSSPNGSACSGGMDGAGSSARSSRDNWLIIETASRREPEPAKQAVEQAAGLV
jgi:hypothetical protein